MNEGAGLRELEVLIERGDGGDLAIAERCGIEGGKFEKTGSERFFLRKEFTKGFWAMEGEDLAGAGLRVTLIGEACNDASSFVEKWQRNAGVLYPLELRISIVLGLIFGRSDVLTEGFLFASIMPIGCRSTKST